MRWPSPAASPRASGCSTRGGWSRTDRGRRSASTRAATGRARFSKRRVDDRRDAPRLVRAAEARYVARDQGEAMRTFFVAALLLALPAGARTIVVHRGGSIRDAIASAVPGDRIVVLPGTDHQRAPAALHALTITKSAIELVGAGD